MPDTPCYVCHLLLDAAQQFLRVLDGDWRVVCEVCYHQESTTLSPTEITEEYL